MSTLLTAYSRIILAGGRCRSQDDNLRLSVRQTTTRAVALGLGNPVPYWHGPVHGLDSNHSMPAKCRRRRQQRRKPDGLVKTARSNCWNNIWSMFFPTPIGLNPLPVHEPSCTLTTQLIHRSYLLVSWNVLLKHINVAICRALPSKKGKSEWFSMRIFLDFGEIILCFAEQNSAYCHYFLVFFVTTAPPHSLRRARGNIGYQKKSSSVLWRQKTWNNQGGVVLSQNLLE